MKDYRSLSLLGLALLMAGCQNPPLDERAPPSMPSRGQAFAEATCGGCHAVTLYGRSSNPNAPPFGYIANQEGVTKETLTVWLSGAHNYPMEMDFYLQAREVDDLVGYLLSLKDPHYRRPPD
jgi:mono/diheme cytochrome c family protein